MYDDHTCFIGGYFERDIGASAITSLSHPFSPSHGIFGFFSLFRIFRARSAPGQTHCTALYQERHSGCKSSVLARGAFSSAPGSPSGRDQWGSRWFHPIHHVARERSPGKIAANRCTGFRALTAPSAQISLSFCIYFAVSVGTNEL